MKEGTELENILFKMSFEQRTYYHQALAMREQMKLYGGLMTTKMTEDYQLLDMSINLCHEGHDPEVLLDAVTKSYSSYELMNDLNKA